MLDRGRVMLIGGAVFTLLAWGYKLWPSGSHPPRPVPAVAVAVPLSAAAVALAAVPPPPPLSPAALNRWVGVHRSARDPFFTVAEIDAMNRPPRVSHPTAPVSAVPPSSPLPAYSLTLIMTAGSERLASIDDRVVKVGDTMGSERVVQILPDAVILDRGGARRRLLLSPNESALSLIQIERVR